MERKEYRIVATDLDGTLLTDDKKLTPKNKQVIEAFIEKGGYFVPATGRPISGIPEFLTDIKGVKYIILSNGAAVYDLQKKEIIYKNQFTANRAKQLIAYLRQFDTMLDFYAEGVGRMEQYYLNHLGEYDIEPEIQKVIKKTRKPVENLERFLEEHPCDVEKLNLFFADQQKRRNAFQTLEELDDVLVTSSVRNNIEINARTCNKGNALHALADYLHIPIENTMAFGDNSNDIAMLKEAGLGVAMKNGSEPAKEAGDLVSDYSNNESGVALAIEKWNTIL